MIIDAHNHPDWWGYNFDKFLSNMDQYHIDVTWLLSWEAPKDEYDPIHARICPHDALFASQVGPISFSRCLSYKEKCPHRFVLGYAPDPRRPEAIDLLEGAIETYGVQVYGELKLRMCYDNPDALRMFRFCGEKKLPVIVHLDYEFERQHKYPRLSYWYGGGFDALKRALRACPETIFLGHAPGFWAHISGDDKFDKEPYPKGPIIEGGKLIQTLRECDNLWLDISANSGLNALTRDITFTVEFLQEFQDRIVYGRDNFDNKHQEFLNSLQLPQSILEKIYWRNAARLASLPSFS